MHVAESNEAWLVEEPHDAAPQYRVRSPKYAPDLELLQIHRFFWFPSHIVSTLRDLLSLRPRLHIELPHNVTVLLWARLKSRPRIHVLEATVPHQRC